MTIVYRFLCMAITFQHCYGLRLSGIPAVNYGSRQELTCYQGGLLGISDTEFHKDTQLFARITCTWLACPLQLFDASFDKDDFETSCSWTIRKLIIKKVDDRYNNSVWQCNSRRTDSNEYTMTVQDLQTCPFTASIKGNVSNVVEGNDLKLTCHANTNDHYLDYYLDYSWTVYHNDGTTTRYEARSIYKTASRGDTGMFNCQIKKGEYCMSEAQIDIKVQYHPRVSIYKELSTSTIHMTCIGDGYPDNFTFYGWQHYINDQLVRILKGNETRGTSMLLLTQVTALDNGKYVCLLSNGIKDTYGHLNSSAALIFNFPATPTVFAESYVHNYRNGSNCNLEVVYLDDENLATTWKRNGRVIHSSVRSSIRVESADVSHPYNTNIKISGFKTILTITSMDKDDEGNYSCAICNRQGCTRKFLQLRLSSNPRSPQNRNNSKQANDGRKLTPTIVASVSSVLVISFTVVILVLAFRCRKLKASRKAVESHYDHTVPTAAPVYDVMESPSVYYNVTK